MGVVRTGDEDRNLQQMHSLPLFLSMLCFLLCYADAMTKPKMYLARDHENKTHILKVKSGGSNGRLPHPEKKKHKKSGVSPEEAFERKYFSKSKHKPSHGDYAAGSRSDYDEDEPQTMTIVIEETQIAGGHAYSGL